MNEIDNSNSNNNPDDLDETSATASLGGAREIELKNTIKLRNWWHRILGIYGRYPCNAFLLVLPSDQEAVQYLKQDSRELHQISGDSCLVIALTDREGFCTNFDEQLWETDIDKYVADGQSVSIGRHFGVPVADFPCLVIFHDIRQSSEHVTVKLEALSTEDIAATMREVFSVISKAVDNKQNPLVALIAQRRNKSFLKMGKTIISDIQTFLGNSFDTALKAYVTATAPHY